MKRITFSLSVIGLFLSTLNASAQWTHIKGPTGGTVTVRHLPFTDKVFVTGPTGTAFTTDAGKSWTDVPAPIGGSMGFLASDGSRLYTQGYKDGYVSADLGKTWQISSNGLLKDQYGQIKKSAMYSAAPTKPNLMYMGTLYDPEDGGIGILKSTDFGASWNPALPFTWWFDIYMMGMYEGTMYGFQSGGKIFKWNDNNGFKADTILSPEYKQVTCFSDGGQWFFAGTLDGLYRLANDKRKWSKVVVDTLDLWIYDISVRGATIGIATNAGLYISEDDGDHWTHEAPDVLPKVLNSVFVTTSGIYTGGGDGLLYIKKKGATDWVASNYFSASLPLNFVAAIDDELFVQQYDGSTYSSTDGFETFQKLPWNFGRFSALVKYKNMLATYSTDSSFGLSSDKGKNWNWYPDVLGSPVPTQKMLFSLYRDSIKSTYDNGKTWQSTNSPDGTACLAIGEVGDSLALVTNRHLYYSTNLGASWQQSADSVLQLAAAMVKNNTIYLWGYYFFEIRRRGSTTSEFPAGLQLPSFYNFSSNSIIASIFNTKIALSINEGSSWDSVPLPKSSYLQNIAIIDSDIYAATSTGLWKYKIGTLGLTDTKKYQSLSISIYPNPIGNQSTIQFSLEHTASVKLDVTDALGRIIDVVDEAVFDAGTHRISYDATRLKAGIYYFRLRADGKSCIRVVVKPSE